MFADVRLIQASNTKYAGLFYRKNGRLELNDARVRLR